MAVSKEEEALTGDAQILERAYLTYIIPSDTDFDVETTLKEGSAHHKPLLDAIEQREWLFFGKEIASSVSCVVFANHRRLDETIDIYPVLQIPYADRAELESSLERISVSLEVQIVNGHNPERDSPPGAEVIYNGNVENTEVPIIVVDQEDTSTDGEEIRWAYAVWKLSVFLARPRIRLQTPSVLFLASASLRPEDPEQFGGVKKGYMQSRVPSGLNLLDAFTGDPVLGGLRPRLSASRVSRVAPLTKPAGQLQVLKGLPSLSKKIYPVAHPRVRFARPNTAPPSPALIALLEMDFTPFFDCEALLEKITLSVSDGVVEDLNTQDGMGLPLSCVGHDHVTFIYRLSPAELDDSGRPPARDLDLVVEVTVLLQPGKCTPRLRMAWTTMLDFTLPVNPGFGQPMTQPIRRSHRPSQLSIGGGADAESLAAPSISRPDALPSLEAATKRGAEVPIPEFGITMTFSGPEQPVRLGDEFVWTVFVVNRSKADAPVTGTTAAPNGNAAASARKLALVVIPRRRRNELRIARPPSTAGVGAHRDPLVADAVLDENIVHAMQRSSLVDGTDVVCLSADVRVGPLAPNACAVVELRFLTLREGIVGVEAVRVVDLGSQEHVDVRELPVVIVTSADS
jgi:hypothetical protein